MYRNLSVYYTKQINMTDTGGGGIVYSVCDTHRPPILIVYVYYILYMIVYVYYILYMIVHVYYILYISHAGYT